MKLALARYYVVIAVTKRLSVRSKRIVSVSFTGVAKFDASGVSNESRNITVNESEPLSRSDTNAHEMKIRLSYLGEARNSRVRVYFLVA